ncbi:MAG: carbon-nitrogen hydrolase family protein [Armatimonadetes bacterium]|nr:carbon-nitrogen hydrolase family protein [Armatimonadota bacterium]
MRKVRIGTVSFLVEETATTVEANIEKALDYVGEAAARGCDIALLPESFNCYNLGPGAVRMAEAAEEISGPISMLMSEQARELSINIAANFPVREGGRVYNQTTFYARDGSIAGFYRKVQPTVAEVRQTGVTPGDTIDVISLDFGCVGCITCMDLYFPELVRILSAKGAEVIFFPTMSHGPSEYTLQTQLCARALDYCVTMVEANYSKAPPYAPYAGRHNPGRARIVDFDGLIIADTGHRPGIAVADVDLDARRTSVSVCGITEVDDLRSDLLRMTRLDLYAHEYAKLDEQRRVRSEGPAY